MKIGDTVRFLNAVGGGVITRIDGKIAYVDDNGFETPMLVKELVVVLPAGHQQEGAGRLLFDQTAYDAGKMVKGEAEKNAAAPKPAPAPEAPAPERPAPETDYGDKLNVALAFEPSDVKHLDRSTFNAVLVNDSNYYLSFAFLRRSMDERGWTLVYAATVAPNELIDLVETTHEDISKYERVALQAVAYKKDKPFELKTPIWAARRLDLTKFHKFHCFRPNLYFDDPVLEVPLMTDDAPVGKSEPDMDDLKKMYENSMKGNKDARSKVKEQPQKKAQPHSNPNAAGPIIEVDLHMSSLTDSLAGMQPADMLEMQLATVRRTMKENAKRLGQKIVFIHGKGEGVLRNAVLKLLKKEFPSAELQDASFREYGFGATQATIHADKNK